MTMEKSWVMMKDQTKDHARIVGESSPCMLRCCFNPFKPSDMKWLHFKVFKAILVQPTIFNFLTFRHSGGQS